MADAPSAGYSLTVRLEIDGVARAAHATGVVRRRRRREAATDS